MARKSLTLVKVGPGDHQIAQPREEPGRVVVGEKEGRIEAERAGAGQGGGVDDGACRIVRLRRRRRRCRRYPPPRRRYPARRPARAPVPARIPGSARRGRGRAIVTVSSPPERITARRPCACRLRGKPRMRRRQSRASPSRCSPSSGAGRSRPRAPPLRRRARASAGRATKRNSPAAKTGSPGFGVSLAGSPSARSTLAGSSMR